MPNKFSAKELASLGKDLLSSGFDSLQMAEAIKMFVAQYGYGISLDVALNIAASFARAGWNVRCFSNQLESLALAM